MSMGVNKSVIRGPTLNKSNNQDGLNPVLHDEDGNNNQNEFEPPEIINKQTTGTNNYNPGSVAMQNYTFYAGQNSKFFDKRILISQKKNRKIN